MRTKAPRHHTPCRLSFAALLLVLSVGCAAPRRPDRPFSLPPSAVPGSALGASGVSPGSAELRRSPLGALPLDTPLETLLEAARRLNRLRTIRGFTDQRVETRGRTLLLRASFLFARPRSIRYEYVEPVEQTILCDGETVWMLPPRPTEREAAPPHEGRRRWVQRELRALGITERSSLGLIPGYGLDLLAPLPVDSFTYSFEARGPRRTTVLLSPRADGPPGLQALRIDLDPTLAVVTAIRFYVGGADAQAQGEVRYSDFQATPEGVFFPRRAQTVWRLEGGDLRVDARHRSLVFNRPVPPERFQPGAPGP